MIDEILQLDHFAPIDRCFADFLASRFNACESARLLFALTSSCHRAGHSCFRLSSLRDLPFYDDFRPALDKLAVKTFSNSAIGVPGDYRPVIKDGDRWYLHRYHHYEDNISQRITRRLRFSKKLNIAHLYKILTHYFPPTTEIDWQETAAALAVCGYFTIISGGPGTGKTTTVAGILAVMRELLPQIKDRVAIAAPTGKAAARLEESLKGAGTKLGIDIPTETATIHRLLGVMRGKSYFRHNRENQLTAEVVIIDEVSMVDLALMSDLLDAVPDTSRLILLGDKDQLASVKPGSVLGDLCGSNEINQFSRPAAELLAATTGNRKNISVRLGRVPRMLDHIVQLEKTYRYPPHSGIAATAQFINKGQGEQALKVLEQDKTKEINIVSLTVMENRLKELAEQFYSLYLRENELEKIFTAFAVFRILAAVRQGGFGVEAINNFIENTLATMKLIKPKRKPFYHGRPIMVRRNDYSLRLFNGDTGIVLFDRTEKRLLAFFQDTDGSFRKLPPARLPEHETVFAMTVHKSQGSEYEHIALVLPETDANAVTRELLYTAVTRAKKTVTVFAEKAKFIKAVQSRTQRMSGLGRKLWTDSS